MAPQILVVDDDQKAVNIIKLYLEKNNYDVLTAYDGHTALDLALSSQPDLIVLDIMLPGIDGLEFCYQYREHANTPIIMLTARTTVEDKLIGLKIGADDYMSKPFSPRELVARVEVVLRRTNSHTPQSLGTFTCGALHIDYDSHEAYIHGEALTLTPKEFKLLEILSRHVGRAFSRNDLITQVFGYNYNGTDRTIDVHIRNLRKKIEPNPSVPTYVQTVFGHGYKFVGDC